MKTSLRFNQSLNEKSAWRTPVLSKQRSAKQWIWATTCWLIDMFVCSKLTPDCSQFLFLFCFFFSYLHLLILQIRHFIYNYEHGGSLTEGLSLDVSGQRPPWTFFLVMSRIRILWRFICSPITATEFMNVNSCWSVICKYLCGVNFSLEIN